MDDDHNPSIDALYDLVRRTHDKLPEPIAEVAQDVMVQIVDWPDETTLRAMEITDPRELTGLYDGIPLTEKSFADQPFAPDVIWLFRMPILDEWRERGTVALSKLVAHIYIHELAHHFGWSDEDIAEIDRWWE